MKETKLKNYEFCLIYLPDLIKPFYHQYITVGLRKMGGAGNREFLPFFRCLGPIKIVFSLKLWGKDGILSNKLNN